jgi:hypothetical protein
MLIVDKTGRKVKVGQVVDVMMLGMFQGQVVKIVDQLIALPDNSNIPPHIIIQIIATPHIHPNGVTPDVYIIAQPDPKAESNLITGDSDGKAH